MLTVFEDSSEKSSYHLYFLCRIFKFYVKYNHRRLIFMYLNLKNVLCTSIIKKYLKIYIVVIVKKSTIPFTPIM